MTGKSQNKPERVPDDCVVFDTETTGFDPAQGDRIIEIGAVRMRGGLPTNQTYHSYVNPERTVPEASVKVHGLTTAFLADKPLFGEIAHDFLEFIGNDPLVAHNAAFDAKFVNAELSRMGITPLSKDRFVDTVPIARRQFPGAQANLDALCRRFKISLDNRDKHGALIDSQLLAEVIVELMGGRQQSLFGLGEETRTESAIEPLALPKARGFVLRATPEERAAHAAFLEEKLGPDNLWAQYLDPGEAAA